MPLFYLLSLLRRKLNAVANRRQGSSCCPELYTRLLHQLGGPDEVFFADASELHQVQSPRVSNQRCLAIIALIPCVESEESKIAIYGTNEDGESHDDVFALQQTIHRVCGLYALLHAACNGLRLAQIVAGKAASSGKGYVRLTWFLAPKSVIACLMGLWGDQGSHACERYLEDSQAVDIFEREMARHDAKVGRCSACPFDTETKAPCYRLPGFLNHHYLAFVQSSEAGMLYEVDGDHEDDEGPWPLRCSIPPGEDLRSPRVADAIKAMVQKRYGGRVSRTCSMMALVQA